MNSNKNSRVVKSARMYNDIAVKPIVFKNKQTNFTLTFKVITPKQQEKLRNPAYKYFSID